MLALSIQQPYAHLIIRGAFINGKLEFKDIENREWLTKHRGPFQVHASKKINHQAIEYLIGKFPGITLPQEFATGGIIGVADIMDCVKTHKSRWFSGPFGFVLANPYPLPFEPCNGALGLFDPRKFQPVGKVAA